MHEPINGTIDDDHYCLMDSVVVGKPAWKVKREMKNNRGERLSKNSEKISEE